MNNNNNNVKETRKNRNKRVFWQIVTWCGLALVLFSLYNRYNQNKFDNEKQQIVQKMEKENSKKMEQANAKIEENRAQLIVANNKKKETDEKIKKLKESEAVKFALKEEKIAKTFKEFTKMSSDVIAYVEIPNLEIEEPICKTKDNSYYLRKNLLGQYYENGTAFVEQNNKTDFTDDNTVIYHHNMLKEGVDFSSLYKLTKDGVASKHPYINLYYNNKLHVYKIFSSYMAYPDVDYRSLQFYDTFDKLDYLEELYSRSEVELEKPNFNENTKIVTLSTCAEEGMRTVVHAILVEDDSRVATIYD